MLIHHLRVLFAISFSPKHFISSQSKKYLARPLCYGFGQLLFVRIVSLIFKIHLRLLKSCTLFWRRYQGSEHTSSQCNPTEQLLRCLKVCLYQTFQGQGKHHIRTASDTKSHGWNRLNGMSSLRSSSACSPWLFGLMTTRYFSQLHLQIVSPYVHSTKGETIPYFSKQTIL